jgi:hypothetical protein
MEELLSKTRSLHEVMSSNTRGKFFLASIPCRIQIPIDEQAFLDPQDLLRTSTASLVENCSLYYEERISGHKRMASQHV